MAKLTDGKLIYLLYSEEDVQGIAENMGYNRLSQKRLIQVQESLSISDSVFDEIQEAIESSVGYVMEELGEDGSLRSR